MFTFVLQTRAARRARGAGTSRIPRGRCPALVWALPIVGFIGVGIAVAAYCSFGTSKRVTALLSLAGRDGVLGEASK
jgi:hypothetical protein